MFPLEFRGKVKHEETRVMGLSSSEDRMIVGGVVLTQCQRVTDGRTDGRMDGQTDRRTDGFTIANTALSIASYADALYKSSYVNEPEGMEMIWRCVVQMEIFAYRDTFRSLFLKNCTI